MFFSLFLACTHIISLCHSSLHTLTWLSCLLVLLSFTGCALWPLSHSFSHASALWDPSLLSPIRSCSLWTTMDSGSFLSPCLLLFRRHYSSRAIDPPGLSSRFRPPSPRCAALPGLGSAASFNLPTSLACVSRPHTLKISIICGPAVDRYIPASTSVCLPETVHHQQQQQRALRHRHACCFVSTARLHSSRSVNHSNALLI